MDENRVRPSTWRHRFLSSVARRGTDASPLQLPLRWARLQQSRQGNAFRLPPADDWLDGVRRQQAEPQHPADVGRIDPLLGSQILHPPVA